jgi:hypothetical protein
VDGLNGNYRGYEAIKALAADMGNGRAMLRGKPRGRPAPVSELLAMSRNRDPYYAGTETDWLKAQWFHALWTHFGYTAGVHLRRVHYRVVTPAKSEPLPQKHDGTPYENTELCWSYLQEAVALARYLNLVAPDAFVDHRNPPPHLFMHLGEPRDEGAVWFEDLPEWTLPRINTDLSFDTTMILPGIFDVTGYDYQAIDQPYHLEIWIEKSTMNDVLLPVCQELHINLITGEGFQSITNVVEMLKRVARFGKPARIFYISDFDPASDGMPVAVARQAEFWLPRYAPNADVKLTPLALTRQQVVAYELPRIMVKDSDTRKGGFEERYGEGAVELDALEALYPDELGRVVRDAVLPYRDPELAAQLQDAAAEAQAQARAAWAACMAPHEAALARIRDDVQRLAARFEHELERLSAAWDVALAPIQERLDGVRHAVQVELDAFTCELPERPEPDMTSVDESAWLFDASRSYFEQLEIYKARKNGHGVEELTA